MIFKVWLNQKEDKGRLTRIWSDEISLAAGNAIV
jgi:hypothetical protein